jgi:hypothetical protein
LGLPLGKNLKDWGKEKKGVRGINQYRFGFISHEAAIEVQVV